MKKINEKVKKIVPTVLAVAMLFSLAACGGGTETSASPSPASDDTASGPYFDADATAEEIVTAAAQAGKVGNWGLGNEYEVQALLSKYGQPTTYLSQAFDMDGFDDDSIMLASAMTYNELGLVVNDYEGGYSYGDTVSYIDMNDEGVAMLEDNIFCTKAFAEANPNTVAAFLYASMKGWEYACENPEEAAEIVYSYGSSVSSDHQAYMAEEVKKLVETDTKGNTVTSYGNMDERCNAADPQSRKAVHHARRHGSCRCAPGSHLDDIRDGSYLETALASDGTFSPRKPKFPSSSSGCPRHSYGLLCCSCKGLLR
jgi:NitT/TauT family transport system substrate-binding protein